MKTSLQSAIRRVREIWAELEYAQRRLFAIRTGIDITGQARHGRRAARPAGA
jgi:hypothetical protein